MMKVGMVKILAIAACLLLLVGIGVEVILKRSANAGGKTVAATAPTNEAASTAPAAPIKVAVLEGAVADKLLVEEVEKALSLSPEDADIPAALAIVIAQTKDLNANEDVTDSLVVALNKGDKQHALSSLIMEKVKINDSVDFQKEDEWKYGTYVVHGNLARLLWNNAQKLSSTDPQKAASYARASMILGAYTEFYFSSAIVQVVSKDLEKFAKIAHLTDSEKTAIAELVKAEKQHDQNELENGINADTLHDKIVQSQEDTLDAKNLHEALLAIQKYRESSDARLRNEYDAITCAWELLNFSKHKKDVVAIAQITDQLADWKSKATNKVVRRWIQEAITTTGPTPSLRVESNSPPKKLQE